jgi:hypothetical protein
LCDAHRGAGRRRCSRAGPWRLRLGVVIAVEHHRHSCRPGAADHDHDHIKGRPDPPGERHSLPSTPVTPEDVIRAWADTLRHGQIRAASRYFAPLTIVANGGSPLELKTRAAVRFSTPRCRAARC